MKSTPVVLFDSDNRKENRVRVIIENARVGRALTLYEVGNRNDAITEMEDVSMSLKGYPEVVARRIEDLMMEKRRQERAFMKMGSRLSAQRMRRSGRC
ncbi:hypothetical protein ACLB2K_006551 [Fragaria x ananassa]